MTKVELIERVAEVNESTKVEAKKYIETIINTITEELVAGEDVKIAGFGNFTVVDVAERTGIVQLGENKGSTYTTPAHKAPKFKFGSNVKKLVAEK